MLRLTGTFLDEITHDIPSQNWGAEEWRREFELFRRIGIDTAVIIRAGYRDRCIFPSQTLPDQLPLEEDLARLFFELGEEFGVGIWFGLYDSGRHWHRGSWWKEAEINRAFVDEVVERYGHHTSFAGWYVSHETSRNDHHIVELFREQATFCKAALDRPVLISPFPQGSKQFGPGDTFTLDESLDHWDRIFAETAHAIDVCAFQDGQIQYGELPEFHQGMTSLGKKHGLTMWANVETFDRDMPIKFPPADWRYLKLKMREASPHVEKLITFEFPHFLSPNSVWPAAHNLFKRYCEAHGIKV